MSGKDNHDSIASKGDSELKDPGRRQVLGVAVVAAAFTAGRVGSVEAQPAPGLHGGLVPAHGGVVRPQNLPGAGGYAPVSHFHDQAAKQVYADAAVYRQKVSDYAKTLRQMMNLPDNEFKHVIRLEPLACDPQSPDCCACCCS
jgi:hypothetical protein